MCYVSSKQSKITLHIRRMVRLLRQNSRNVGHMEMQVIPDKGDIILTNMLCYKTNNISKGTELRKYKMGI